jgi:hypothetical protein
MAHHHRMVRRNYHVQRSVELMSELGYLLLGTLVEAAPPHFFFLPNQ